MRVDVAIIGAGIAGAGLAYELLQRAPDLAVALLEAEDQPGYHTTGRSAAFYAATYGGPAIAPLTLASRAFLETPPADFSHRSFLGPRGALHVAAPADRALLDAMQRAFERSAVPYERLGKEGILARLPLLQPAYADDALWEPGCADIAVAELHHAYLGQARKRGAALVCTFRVRAMTRAGGQWVLRARQQEEIRARIVVNAAGAWVDEVAELAGRPAIGFRPMRRTMVVADVTPAVPNDAPLAMDAAGRFYFRPDAGKLWISPHDETPVPPQDVQPEREDIALAVERFAAASQRRLERVVRAWAGLRTFAPDRLPVVGHDPHVPGFFWLAGQGGWGIQTAPAMSALAAALLLERTPEIAGVDPALYRPERFR